MELYKFPRKAIRKSKEVTQSWPSTWPNLNSLLRSLDNSITCLQISQVPNGHKAIFRFKNSYGLEVFKDLESDFYEIVVIRFPGEGIDKYEFASSTAISGFNLGYDEEDIFRICAQVSSLR
jgi:hypothetical protein